MRSLLTYLLVHLLFTSAWAQAPDYKRNDVDSSWTEIGSYASVGHTWTIRVPYGRRARIGMGIWISGNPGGEVKDFTSYYSFSTIGPGKFKVKFIDGGPTGPAEVYSGRIDVNMLPELVTPTPTPPETPVLHNNLALANAFGYVKNALLRSEHKGTESMDGHVNWAVRQPEKTVKDETLRLLNSVEKLYREKQMGPDEPWAWGDLKNARLVITGNKPEDLAGHAHWYEVNPNLRAQAMEEEFRELKARLSN